MMWHITMKITECHETSKLAENAEAERPIYLTESDEALDFRVIENDEAWDINIAENYEAWNPKVEKE
jgi:hypothetical protein